MSLARRVPVLGIVAGIALLIVGFNNGNTALFIVGGVLFVVSTSLKSNLSIGKDSGGSCCNKFFLRFKFSSICILNLSDKKSFKEIKEFAP